MRFSNEHMSGAQGMRLATLCLVLIFLLPSYTIDSSSKTSRPASVFGTHASFVRSSVDPVRVLIVPGHDDEVWGAQHRTLKEVDLNRQLGEYLYTYFAQDPQIKPILVSDTSGYVEQFESYLTEEKSVIENFITEAKQKFISRIGLDVLQKKDTSFHNEATEDVARTLYGINLWANRQRINIVIHIHFNDYPGRPKNKAGVYKGFAVYAPADILKNFESSQKLAQSVFDELKKIIPVSNLASENSGLVTRHELIALGAHDTLDAASILVEYGYIYEPLFVDEALRDVAFDFLAYSTYVGIKKSIDQEPRDMKSKNAPTDRVDARAVELREKFKHALRLE